MTEDLLTQDPRHKTGPVMKPAPEPRQPPPPAPKKPVAASDDPWHPMTTAPKDGSYLFLRGDVCEDKVVPNEWYWYSTRQFRKGTWQATGWWRRRFGPAVAPGFTPTGWRSVKEGPLQ